MNRIHIILQPIIFGQKNYNSIFPIYSITQCDGNKMFKSLIFKINVYLEWIIRSEKEYIPHTFFKCKTTNISYYLYFKIYKFICYDIFEILYIKILHAK